MYTGNLTPVIVCARSLQAKDLQEIYHIRSYRWTAHLAKYMEFKENGRIIGSPKDIPLPKVSFMQAIESSLCRASVNTTGNDAEKDSPL